MKKYSLSKFNNIIYQNSIKEYKRTMFKKMKNKNANLYLN